MVDMDHSLKVGLIGCGAIGRTLALAIIDGKAGNVELSAICDIDEERLESLHKELGREEIKKYMSPFDLLKVPGIELVIEAATREAVKDISERALEMGKSLLVMSAGAFSDKDLYETLYSKAGERKLKIYIPSGAIIGLDGVKSASVEKLRRVEIISTKTPRSLEGAPYLKKNNIDISHLTEAKILFQGTADKAIEGFPKNVNVAVILSLAGIGVENTLVTIVADPKASLTKHEIKAEGDFGELHGITQNYLHPDNPKTSYLAPLSAIRLLKKISEPVQVGT
jgi:aspartate dehydrogenase